MGKTRTVSLVLVLLSVGGMAVPPGGARAGGLPWLNTPRFVDYFAPATLSYQELLRVAEGNTPPVDLLPRLEALLTNPSLNNQANPGFGEVELDRDDQLGAFIRVGFWNIERGLRMDDIRMAFERPEEFLAQVRVDQESPKYQEIQTQLEVLRSVDVLALNEVDLGLKRTDYRDITRELAAILGLNYTFGVEFLELDPVNLGTQPGGSGQRDSARIRDTEVDQDRYLGLHGNAILSRFPIRKARLIPLETQPYDWFVFERRRVGFAENARRKLGLIALSERVPREIRYGGRTLLIAELHVPQLEGGTLTVATIHLENRCTPADRRRQIEEVLTHLQDVEGPLVLAGDFNTSGSSMQPTSISKEVKNRVGNRNFWARQAIRYFSPFGLAADFTIEALRFARTTGDPTASAITLIAPNAEAEFFRVIERMRFNDGYGFDFRGDPERTVNNTGGTLANSNQRNTPKGFVATHGTERTYWAVGKNKLDWIFVKAYTRAPRGPGEPYRMAPHRPWTLERLNYSLSRRMSDHSPITVDLPLNEPDL